MKYFVKDKNTKHIEEDSTLQEISSSLEWQDVAHDAYEITDRSGNRYQWDKQRQNEIGLVYGYTIIKIQ